MTDAQQYIDTLWAKGREFLGTRYAIMAGAMTWVSERKLVSAISNAGAFGVLACGSMPPDILRAEIEATKALTDNPFGVNLIVMHPQLEELADICIEQNVTHVVLAGGVPKKEIIERLHNGGCKVLALPPTLALAKRFVRSGVDALIIEGMEAGGHIGPVSLGVLAQEILPHITDVPVFVAGGIARGESMVSYLEMGAAGCQMGTLFVASEECVAHEKFKKAFVRAGARDAVTTVQLDPRFPVIPVRALSNEGSQEFMAKQKEVIGKFESGELDMMAAQLEIEHFWAGSLRRAVQDGDVESGSVMAGQSVGMIKEVRSVDKIVEGFVSQALESVSKRHDGMGGSAETLAVG